MTQRPPEHPVPSRQPLGIVAIFSRWITTVQSSIWGLNLGILGAYVLVTIAVTYPAVKGLVYPYVVPGVGDSRYYLWHTWWIKHALLDLRLSPTFTNAIYHPMGGPFFLLTPFNELASISLQPLMGLTRTYTLLWLFSFVAAGFATYLLGVYFTHNRGVAFMGGLIFSFSARHYAQAMEHLNLSTIQWFPLYALALFMLLKRPTLKTTTFTAVTLVLAIVSELAYYVLYFVVPFTALFIVYHWFTQHLSLRQRKFWLSFIGASLIAALLALPFGRPLLRYSQEGFLKQGGLTNYSADVLAYFTPAERHPVWHALGAPLYENFRGNEEEQTVFIGYTAIALMLFAIRTRRNKCVKFWLILGTTAFIFSWGPILHVNGEVKLTIPDKGVETYVPMPYWLLLNLPLFNVLRAPARLSVTVQLAVAVLAIYGLDTLTNYWSGVRRAVGYTALGIFILFESLFQFPYRMDMTSLIPPPIYSIIAQEKDNLAVLEIPSRRESGKPVPVKNLGFHTYYFMYYATVHQHPLVGGFAARVHPAREAFLDTTAFIRELMYPVQLVDTSRDIVVMDNNALVSLGSEILAKYDIGYVVMHRDLVAEYVPERGQPVLETMLRQALGDPFYDDGNIVGFRVPKTGATAQLAHESIILGDGWYPKTSNFNDHTVRWMRPTGNLLIYKRRPARMRLSMTAFSPMSSDVIVAMTVNGTSSGEFQVAPTSDTLLTRPFPLTSGRNELKFEVWPVSEPVHQLDPRVYLGVYNIDLQSVLDVEAVSPVYRRQINLGHRVEFIGYDQNADRIRGGETLHLTLYWHSLDLMDDNYQVFVHVLDSDGNLRMQHDGIPRGGTLPTSYWGREEVVVDEHDIVIPADVPPGQYQIWTGMYSLDTMQRLEIRTASNSTADNGILLGNLHVESSP